MCLISLNHTAVFFKVLIKILKSYVDLNFGKFNVIVFLND